MIARLPSLLLAGSVMSAAFAVDVVRVELADNGQALVNPGMGWTMHFYSNIISNYGSQLEPSDALDDFPGLSTVYLRLPWSFLEPREGEFDWSVVDTPAQRWIAKGKQVAFRVTCCESWLRYATPEWVQQAGARGHNFSVGTGVDPDGPYWEPIYDDPVFLAKLEQFLKEFSRHYDGNPNVAFIDVGSYGVWGEGHCLASTRLEVDDAVKLKHIALHRKYFQKTLLAVSDDYVGHDQPVTHHLITDYMLDQGMTLRDDSICVQPPPRSWFHAELAGSFWPRFPVVLEHEHYGSSVDRNAWLDGSLLERAIEDYHASYMSIHWWPREFLEKNRDTIDRINRRIGYRLQLRAATWPREIAFGQPFTVGMSWSNAGVAPCYPGGYVAVTLKDARGGIVSLHVLDRFNTRALQVGPPKETPVEECLGTFVIAQEYRDRSGNFARAATAGMCDVFVSVGSLDGTPQIALPLEDDDGQRRYRIGQLIVTPRND